MKTKACKILQYVAKGSWWCVVIALALLLINIFGAKINGKVPSVFGYSVINIISSSMEGEIPKDSYILIKKVAPEEVGKNDVICFYSKDPQIRGIPNTHRVIEEPIVTEDGIEFVTMGDANPGPDPVNARGEDLIGVYVKRLDGISAFSKSLEGNTLIIIIIVLQLGIGAMVVYTVVASKAKGEGENDEK